MDLESKLRMPEIIEVKEREREREREGIYPDKTYGKGREVGLAGVRWRDGEKMQTIVTE